MVFATDHVLPFVFQFYVKALAPVGVVAEILTYDDVAEISPVAEKSAASAESDTCGRGITCVDLHDVGKGNVLSPESRRWIMSSLGLTLTLTGQ